MLLAAQRLLTRRGRSAKLLPQRRIMPTEEDVGKLRWWQQADEELYTAENIARREENRHYPPLHEIIYNKWWPLVLSAGGLVPVEPAQRVWTLPEPNYIIMLTKFQKALLEDDEEWSREEAVHMAHESWHEDTHGKDIMTRPGFFDCLFELTDMWCPTMDADEYVEFLTVLFDAVTDGVGFRADEDIENGYMLHYLSAVNDKETRMARHLDQLERGASVRLQNTFRRKKDYDSFVEYKKACNHIQKHTKRWMTMNRAFGGGVSAWMEGYSKKPVRTQKRMGYHLPKDIHRPLSRELEIRDLATRSRRMGESKFLMPPPSALGPRGAHRQGVGSVPWPPFATVADRMALRTPQPGQVRSISGRVAGPFDIPKGVNLLRPIRAPPRTAPGIPRGRPHTSPRDLVFLLPPLSPLRTPPATPDLRTPPQTPDAGRRWTPPHTARR